MEPSKLITSLEQALVEAAKPQSSENQMKAKRLIRRLQMSVGEDSDPMTSGILEELGLPHLDDISRHARQEKEWDEERFAIFEVWLKAELGQATSVSRTQQALERKFGFRGDILQKFRSRVNQLGGTFYQVQEEAHILDGKPEITFTKTN